MAGDDDPLFRLRTCPHGSGQPVRLFRQGDVPQQHFGGLEDAGGVCVISLAVFDLPRRGAVNGLEHGVAVADVGAAGGAYAALDLGGLVGDDVAVEVGQQKDLELISDPLIDQIGGHNVDVPVLRLDLRVVRRHLVADAGEHAVGLFHDVGLGDDGDACFSVGSGVFKGSAGNAPGAGVGGHLEIHSQLAGQLDAPAAQSVFPFRVLPEKGPVYALLRDAHRAHVGVKVQLPAQGHVCALHAAALGGGGGAFQQDVAGLDLSQHILRHRFALGKAVFDGQAVDPAQLHPAAL